MTVTEKVSYIKGLADGLDLDKNSKEGKLFAAIIDALEDIALTVSDNSEHIDAVDEDLAALEDWVYEDNGCDGDCDGCDGYDYDYDDDEDEGVYSFECPHCHETVFFDESLCDDDDADLVCPACGAKLDRNSIFEIDDDEE